MQTLMIDTYKAVTRLQKKGFTKDQTEALVKIDLIKWMAGTQLAYLRR